MAERLADKYEEAKEKQEDITNRSVVVQHSVPVQVLLVRLRRAQMLTAPREAAWSALPACRVGLAPSSPEAVREDSAVMHSPHPVRPPPQAPD